MEEFAWRNFRRNNLFIPEYFLKDFYGLKLTKTRATIIPSEGPVSFALSQDAVTTYMELNKQLKNCLHPKTCCPEVVSVTLDVFSGCTNIACRRPVVVIPDQPSTLCQQCNTAMKMSKFPCILDCVLTFEDMEKPLSLPLEVLQGYLQQDVIKLLIHLRIPFFLLRI